MKQIITVFIIFLILLNCKVVMAQKPDIFVVTMEIYQWIDAEVDDDVYYYDSSDSTFHHKKNLAFFGDETGFYKQEFAAIYKKDFAVSLKAAEGLATIWHEESKKLEGYLVSFDSGMSGTFYSKKTCWSNRPHTIHKIYVYEISAESGECSKKQLIPDTSSIILIH